MNFVQLSFILNNDFLSLYIHKDLVFNFFIMFVVTFLPPVREEAIDVTHGVFILMGLKVSSLLSHFFSLLF